MGRHRLCDYCRLQGLRPSPFFSTRAGCDACGTTRMKTAGYAEACALPSLAASRVEQRPVAGNGNTGDEGAQLQRAT